MPISQAYFTETTGQVAICLSTYQNCNHVCDLPLLQGSEANDNIVILLQNKPLLVTYLTIFTVVFAIQLLMPSISYNS